MHRYSLSVIASVIVLIFSLSTTFFLGYLAELRFNSIREEQFEKTAEAIQQNTLLRLTAYKSVLYGMRGLFASIQVNGSIFHAYTLSLDLTKNFPGLGGVGFIREISAAEVPLLTERMKSEGISSFTVHPIGNSEVVAPVLYTTPDDPKNPVLGLNILSDAVRANTLLLAKRSGDIAITSVPYWLSDTSSNNKASFIVYIPLYKNGQKIDTPATREAAILGYVFVPTRISELLGGLLTGENKDLRVILRDADTGSISQSTFFDNKPKEAGGKYTKNLPITFGSKQWILEVHSTKVYDMHVVGKFVFFFVVLGGSICSVLLFMFLYFLSQGRKQALLLAQKMTQELREDKHRLEEAMTKDEFLSMAAHELRTPLGTIRWRLETMLTEKMPPHIHSKTKQNYQNILQLIHLVNNLLDVSRINQGKVKQTPDMVDGGTFIENIVKTMNDVAKNKDVHILFRKPKEAIPLIIDQNLLEEVIVNLLSNAVKYNKPNGRVVVTAQKEKGRFLLIVEDTGIGIPKKDQKTIFSKFKRGSNIDPNAYEGTGLGLFVVKSYVEGWHGSIHLESQEGKGTIITIDLPILRGYNKS